MRAGFMLTLIVIAMLNARCAEDAKTSVIVRKCSVAQDVAGNGVIRCPDGTEIIVPPNVINTTIFVEVPVYIKKAKTCKKSE